MLNARFNDYRRLLATANLAAAAKLQIIADAACDFAKADIGRAEAAEQILQWASAYGLQDATVEVERAIAAGFERGLDERELVPDAVPDLGEPQQPRRKTSKRKANGQAEPPRLIRSSAEFVAGFVPPDYVVCGILQRRCCYSITGKTGAGKTAIMLLLAASVPLVRPFGDREVEGGRVLYFAGENPDDVRARWIALSQQMGFDIETIDVHFIAGTFKISEMQARIRAEIERIGEFALIMIDTSAAFYEGDDINNNAQQIAHAKRLRSLTAMPGGPCVLVACHPPKAAADDNLQPSGGGGFVNEMDGNLVARKDEVGVEVHWQIKFRGPDFAPLSFQLRTVTHELLKDSKGRLLPTVVASYLSEIAQEEIAKVARSRENELLAILEDNKHASQMDLAKLLGWKMRDGKPYRVLVGRTVDALKKAKLVTFKERDGYVLTAAGKKAVGRKDEPDDDEEVGAHGTGDRRKSAPISERKSASADPGARTGTGLPGGLELIGAELPGTPCAHCRSAEGNVLLIRGTASVRAQALHADCAPTWYAGVANKRNTRRNKSTQPGGKNRGRNK